MDRKREKGIEDEVLYEKGGKNLIDVENVETIGGKVLPSELTNTIVCVCVRANVRACVRSSVYMSPPIGTKFGTHMQIHLQRVVGKVPVRSISWLLLISISDITLQMIFLMMMIGPINRQRRTLFVQGNIILRKFNMCSLGVKLPLFRTYCSQLI